MTDKEVQALSEKADALAWEIVEYVQHVVLPETNYPRLYRLSDKLLTITERIDEYNAANLSKVKE